MFTTQNKTKCLQTSYVYKTNKSLQNQSLTKTLCLQNKIKSLQTSYVYKTKVYKHVIFTKQEFTEKLCLQNKTKIYNHVMFIKQNTKHILLSRRVNFGQLHNISVFHSDDFSISRSFSVYMLSLCQVFSYFT